MQKTVYRKIIIQKLNETDIETIDLTNFFNSAKDVEQYYPLGYVGHFNANGYKKVSEIIASQLN